MHAGCQRRYCWTFANFRDMNSNNTIHWPKCVFYTIVDNITRPVFSTTTVFRSQYLLQQVNPRALLGVLGASQCLLPQVASTFVKGLVSRSSVISDAPRLMDEGAAKGTQERLNGLNVRDVSTGRSSGGGTATPALRQASRFGVQRAVRCGEPCEVVSQCTRHCTRCSPCHVAASFAGKSRDAATTHAL